MQKLRGIDGEYDSDSATSNRLAHRKTIHMLEKNRHKKRAIGTLDVAFKKRFLAFTGAPGDGNMEGEIPGPGRPAGKIYGGLYDGKGSRKFTHCISPTFKSTSGFMMAGYAGT